MMQLKTINDTDLGIIYITLVAKQVKTGKPNHIDLTDSARIKIYQTT